MRFESKHYSTGAFTLVEVVLAIAISVGLMFVALFFYSQAANLRTQLIEESEKIGTMRLLLQKIAADLRSAQAHDQLGFTGGSNSISFVKAQPLPFSSWSISSNVGVQYPSSLSQVRYELVSASAGTNLVSLGITHSERPLNRMFDKPGTGGLSESASTSTNYASADGTNNLSATNIVGLLTDKIHTLQFRYWNGTAWTNAWDAIIPPAGVEVIIGIDVIEPTDTNADFYRRVVFLPSGARKPSMEANTLASFTE